MSIIAKMKKNESKMTRRFAFPPTAKPDDRFTVSINYVSPVLFGEKQEEVKVRVRQGARRGEELSEKEFRKLMINDVLVKVVDNWTGLTVGKLRGLLNMSPESVAAAGGLDQEIPYSADEVKGLLEEVSEFYLWVLETCMDLGQFQDKDWEDQVANLKTGQATSSVLQ